MAKEIKIPKIEVPMDRYFTAGKEIYQEIEAKTKEKFGKNSKAYKTIMSGIDAENATGSQFFFNTETNLYLPKGQRVVSLEDMERIYSTNQADNLFDGSFYTDVPELILRTATPTCEDNKHILENLVKQVKAEGYEFDSKNPLRISGLDLVKDENSKNYYGLLLKIGNDAKITNDKRFAFANNEIQIGNQTKTLYTKKNDLSGVFFGRVGDLGARGGGLAGSGGSGRVVIADAEGVVPKNFQVEEAINEKISKLEILKAEYLEKVKNI